MASHTLTLAAYATSAVPGLSAVAVRPHSSSGDNFASAILTTADDEVIVSVPRTQRAETDQAATLLALSALTDGARERLPFAVPRALGITRAGETRAAVYTYLPGARFQLADLADDALLIESLARTIASIHALPASIARQGGLPVRSARDQRLSVSRLIDRAAKTRVLPPTVRDRWQSVLEAQDVWDFESRVVHAALSDDAFLVENDEVTGLLDWSALSLGDPAVDLAWLLEAESGVFTATLERYLDHTGYGDWRALRSRARLYHELELAKWLLHGVDSHDTAVVDDAVALLDRLVDQLDLLEDPIPPSPVVDEHDAIDLLERTPEVASTKSETAAWDALDEGRVFTADTDFIDPLPPSEPEDASEPELRDGDQITQPIDDEDLPDAPSSQR